MAFATALLTTHAAFEDGRVPDASNGLMPFIGSQIAYRAVRTRGTIGGAIALADPAADWLTTIIALEGEVALVGPNGRRTDSRHGFCSRSVHDRHRTMRELIEAHHRAAPTGQRTLGALQGVAQDR